MDGGRAPASVTRPDRRSGVLLELGFVTAALGCYLLVRSFTIDQTGDAITHARSVLALEEALGIDWERAVQGVATEFPGLDTALSQFYFWGWFPTFIPVLVWLYLSHPLAYRTTRNALLASGVAGLVVYAWYPTAPPWIVGSGFADPVTASWMHDIARPAAIDNKLGALPSFHVGWLILVGIVIFPLVRSPVARALCVLYPAQMAWAVVATGNHWVIDIPAGALLAVIGLSAAAALRRLQARFSEWRRRYDAPSAPRSPPPRTPSPGSV